MSEPKYTPNDLNKAIAQFMIVLGAHLPAELTKSLAAHLNQLAEATAQNGEPTVGMLTKGLAQALEMGEEMKRKNQH